MNRQIFKEIYKAHFKQLKYTKIPHKKFVIVFSGIPGSGKTHLAKILEKRYRAVKIRSDSIRTIVDKLYPKQDLDKLTYSYLFWILKNYKFKNKLIILDKGIDRKYKETFSLLKKEGYKIFIIRLKLLKDLSEKRIIKKLGKLDDNYIGRIDKWIREWKDFGKNVKSDIVIENKDNSTFEPLFLKLDKLIK